MDEKIEQAFLLGLHIASYLHGQRLTLDTIQETRAKVYDTLQMIDSGQLSFIDETPRILAKAPPGLCESIMQELPGMLDEARKKERTLVRLLIREMYEIQ